MRKLLFVTLMFTISLAAFGAELNPRLIDYIKANDPNKLTYFYSQTPDCPWEVSEAESTIEGVIKRSRIQPLDYSDYNPNDLYLNVISRCLEVKNVSGTPTGMIHEVVIHFGNYPLLFDKNYGSIFVAGTDGRAYLLNQMKELVEGATTDFVEVNFLSNDN